MRHSVIGSVKIDSLGFGSTAFFGDNVLVAPRSRVLAVRRDIPVFGGNEGSFALYPTFFRNAPHLTDNGELQMEKRDEGPIRVGAVKVTGMSTSAVFQAGSTAAIDAKTWIKQFRQLAIADCGATGEAAGASAGAGDSAPNSENNLMGSDKEAQKHPR